MSKGGIASFYLLKRQGILRRSACGGKFMIRYSLFCILKKTNFFLSTRLVDFPVGGLADPPDAKRPYLPFVNPR
jgi:hypothetical protein